MFKIPEAVGPVTNVELALADTAASDELLDLTVVPVGKAKVLVLLSG